jgi:GntR family transcriptional regulator
MAMTAVQPAFLRVYRALADEISAGRLQAGDRLPSERTLGERLGVSRATVRRAIAELADQGLVETPERRRAFVRGEILTEPPNVLLSFTELGRRRGLKATARLLARTTRTASLLEAEGFGIAPGDPLLSLRRLRFLEDRPVAVDEALVPLAIAPHLAEADVARTSLYDELAAAGSEPVRADYDVGAIAVEEPDASLLGVSPGSPGLLAHTRSHSADGRVVEVCMTVYRGDRYRFQATLSRRPAVHRGRN